MRTNEDLLALLWAVGPVGQLKSVLFQTSVFTFTCSLIKYFSVPRDILKMLNIAINKN